MSQWVRRAGSTARDGFDLAIGPREAGWEHTGLYVVTLAPGESREFAAGEFEWLVLPLAGGCQVECDDKSVQLDGRADPFAGPTDFAYLPRSSHVVLASPGGARIALPHAKASASLPLRRVGSERVSIELRGAGQATREVRNFGMPDVLDADAIIACEVITPSGNWSSWPPHKHDEHHEGTESILEEIYYFEMCADGEAPKSSKPLGYQRVYGSAERPINVMAEVGNGDVVLVPHGWHGPAMAPPGYDMYYLNVMAGPGPDREWLSSDDPDHSWVRQTWADQLLDPRLPLGGRR